MFYVTFTVRTFTPKVPIQGSLLPPVIQTDPSNPASRNRREELVVGRPDVTVIQGLPTPVTLDVGDGVRPVVNKG